MKYIVYRFMLVIVVGLGVVFLGCGGAVTASSPNSNQQSNAVSTRTQAVAVFLTDSPASTVARAHVNISASLTDTKGTAVALSSVPAASELVHLQLAPTLQFVNDVPANRYASMTFSFSSPELEVVAADGTVTRITTGSTPNVSLAHTQVTAQLGSLNLVDSNAALMVDVDVKRSISQDSYGNYIFDPVVTTTVIDPNASGTDWVGAIGQVTAVQSGSFDLQLLSDRSTFHVSTDSTTTYGSSVSSFAKVAVGQVLEVNAKSQGGRNLLARLVSLLPSDQTVVSKGTTSTASPDPAKPSLEMVLY